MLCLQLGQELGTRRLHHDVPQQEEQLWHCHFSQLPCGVDYPQHRLTEIVYSHDQKGHDQCNH